MKTKILLAVSCLMLLMVSSLPVFAATADPDILSDLKKIQNWVRTSHPMDAPMAELYKQDGSFINLGPTGIRAVVLRSAPSEYRVAYVFSDSPANGKIGIGDRIVGVGDVSFESCTPDSFKRHKVTKWKAYYTKGIHRSMAEAIEDCQGKKGELLLKVVKKGTDKTVDVTVRIKPVGRFSETWPWDCPRSEKLRKDLTAYLGTFEDTGRFYVKDPRYLALLACGDKTVLKKMKDDNAGILSLDSNTGGMGITWRTGYRSIMLAEYYSATRDSSAIKQAKHLAQVSEEVLDWTSGGAWHTAFPHKMKSFLKPGKKSSYQAMASPGAYIFLGQVASKAVGLPYSQKVIDRVHHAFRLAANRGRGIPYSFQTPIDSIKLVPNDKSLMGKFAKLAKDVGFSIPGGMAKVFAQGVTLKDFKMRGDDGVVPIPAYMEKYFIPDPEKRTRVYYNGDHLCFFYYTPLEATEIYALEEKFVHGQPSFGPGAVGHYIGGGEDHPGWKFIGDHFATACASGAGNVWNSHAQAYFNAVWKTIGAGWAKESKQREFLDTMKLWIILAETHRDTSKVGLIDLPFAIDGGLPKGGEAYSTVALLALSYPLKNILMTGAPADGAVESNSKPKSRLGNRKPTSRRARNLQPNKQALLDKSLLMALAELSETKKLKPLPMSISKARVKVWLAKVERSDSKLTFQAMKGDKQASFGFVDLTADDRALLSRLVARYRPNDKDAQAIAGIYMEITGNTTVADEYYKKAGTEVHEKLKSLFE